MTHAVPSYLLNIEAVTLLPSPIKINSPAKLSEEAGQKKERKRKAKSLFKDTVVKPPKSPDDVNAKEFLRRKRMYFEMLDQQCTLSTL